MNSTKVGTPFVGPAQLPYQRLKNWVLGMLAVTISLVIAVGLLELYVRLVETDGKNFDIEMWRYAKDLKTVSSINGVGHEHIPGQRGVYMGVPVKINSAGWRDQEHSMRKQAGTIRVMMLGDSVTFGWGAGSEDVTSYRLERLLNTGGKRTYEVINTGIGNANTAMEAAYFMNKGYAYEVDVVVLNYFINDAEPTPRRTSNFLIEHFYSAVFIAGRLDIVMRRFFGKADWHQYYRDLYQENQPGWPAARTALRELYDFCKSRGIKLVIANYPEIHELSPYPFQRITSIVASEAHGLGIPFLDLLPAVENQEPRSLWVTKTDTHPNGKAAGLYAEAIRNFLVLQSPEDFSQP